MGWLALLLNLITLIFKIWDAIKERNDEIKKKKTEALQSGLRGIVDGDASRVTASFNTLNRLRSEKDSASSDSRDGHS